MPELPRSTQAATAAVAGRAVSLQRTSLSGSSDVQLKRARAGVRNILKPLQKWTPVVVMEEKKEESKDGTPGATPTPSTSRTTLSLGHGLHGKKPSLEGQEFVLDVENVRERMALKADIEKLRGTVVEYLVEERLPKCVVSDHPQADKVDNLRNRKLSVQQLRALPALLRDAHRLDVNVRSVAQFRKALEVRVKSARFSSTPAAPVKPKSKIAAKKVHQNRNVHKLAEPFVLFQNIDAGTRCYYEEFPPDSKIFLPEKMGRSLFHPAGEGRAQDAIPDYPLTRELSESSSTASLENDRHLPPLGGGARPYCEICHKSFPLEEPHYESQEHVKIISSSAFYDEVDMECGSTVDWISGVKLKPRDLPNVEWPAVTVVIDPKDATVSSAETQKSSRRSLGFLSKPTNSTSPSSTRNDNIPELYRSPF